MESRELALRPVPALSASTMRTRSDNVISQLLQWGRCGAATSAEDIGLRPWPQACSEASWENKTTYMARLRLTTLDRLLKNHVRSKFLSE